MFEFNTTSLFKSTYVRFILFFALSLCAFNLLHSPKAHAAYDGARLIDNQVFLDANTLNASQIQQFLSDQGAGLATRSFVLTCGAPSDTVTMQAYAAVSAPCGQTVSAATIIYYASQVYGVNPRVTLATMQKEQSLTTAANPTDWQLSQAMGYGCPTSGSCSSASNFFYQIDNGVWALRYHYERSNGNNTWWNTGGFTCGTPKAYYSAGLFPGNTVTFIDQAGVPYRTLTLANAATGAFYCYTPHTYNNHRNGAPNSSNPTGTLCYPFAPHYEYGTTGYCYTGSFNFVHWFEKWFGSTLTPSYGAKVRAQSIYPVMNAGSTIKLYIDYENTGSIAWRDNTSNWGIPPVYLATADPINRNSPFWANWSTQVRPSIVFKNVFLSDGITLAPDQHSAVAGQIVRFEFTLTAPVDMKPGIYRESFLPIVEGEKNWFMGGLSWFDVTILPTTFKGSLYTQSNFPTLKAGEGAILQFQIKNTGTGTWHDGVSMKAGISPVHMATAAPINRPSTFGKSWWSPSRQNLTFSQVYESDGTTLAPDQHKVAPGQIAKYDYGITVPTDTPPGIYREFFKPILEGASNWDFGPLLWVDINVQQTTFKPEFKSQSSYPTINRGQSSQLYFDIRNGGNVTWRDTQSALPGVAPMHLSTFSPINRTSLFSDTSWWSKQRPTLAFNSVYESDGTTLAPDQHKVAPGQIARYQFTIKAPSDIPTGIYREFFLPILEGASNWNTGLPLWIDITII